jgi:hypothetical protein
MITINGKDYAPTDLVEWEDAFEVGGFYFQRAAYLGLPQPPAVLFDENREDYNLAMGLYHARFRKAEARTASSFYEF